VRLPKLADPRPASKPLCTTVSYHNCGKFADVRQRTKPLKIRDSRHPRTAQNLMPKAGGQGVAGSNPVSPTKTRTALFRAVLFWSWRCVARIWEEATLWVADGSCQPDVIKNPILSVGFFITHGLSGGPTQVRAIAGSTHRVDRSQSRAAGRSPTSQLTLRTVRVGLKMVHVDTLNCNAGSLVSVEKVE